MVAGSELAPSHAILVPGSPGGAEGRNTFSGDFQVRGKEFKFTL